MSIRNFFAMGVAVAVIATASFAGNGGCARQGGWNSLNLTSEQQDKIKVLHDEMTTTRDKHRNEIQVVRQKIVDELKKSNPSKSVLDGYARELGELNVKMTQERNEHLLKIKAVLTPEQFNQMVENQKGGMGDHMGMGQGGGRHGCGGNAAPAPGCASSCTAGKTSCPATTKAGN